MLMRLSAGRGPAPGCRPKRGLRVYLLVLMFELHPIVLEPVELIPVTPGLWLAGRSCLPRRCGSAPSQDLPELMSA